MSENTQQPQFIHYLSVLKCIGMFAVIGIHTFCSQVSYYADEYSRVGLYVSYFLTEVLRSWAVPVFVMVSGALFLNAHKTVTLRTLYKKSVPHLLLALLLFGTLFALMELVFTERRLAPAMLGRALSNVYEGKSWDHLWYLYLAITLYVLTPPLRAYLASSGKHGILYVLAVLLAFGCIIPFVNSLTGTTCGFSYISGNAIWLFYYIAGYALHTEQLVLKRTAAIIGITLGTVYCAVAPFFPALTDTYGANIRFADPHSIIGVCMSLSIFVLAKQYCGTQNTCIDRRLVPLSFGVYILHAVWINMFYKVLRLTPARCPLHILYPLVFSATAMLSLVSTWLLRKIGFIRKYVL